MTDYRELDAALARIRKLEKALAPFAAEAATWADSVKDSYRPGMSEPRSRYVNFGSKAMFTIGHCRRARKLLNEVRSA